MDILSNFHHIFAVFHGFSRINDAYKLRDGSCQECLILWILSTIKSWVYCVSFVQHQLACFLNFHPIFGDFLRHSRTLIDRFFFLKGNVECDLCLYFMGSYFCRMVFSVYMSRFISCRYVLLYHNTLKISKLFVGPNSFSYSYLSYFGIS